MITCRGACYSLGIESKNVAVYLIANRIESRLRQQHVAFRLFHSLAAKLFLGFLHVGINHGTQNQPDTAQRKKKKLASRAILCVCLANGKWS